MGKVPQQPRSAEETRVVAALLGLLAVVGLYAFLQSPFFSLARLDIIGTAAVTSEEIAALTGVRTGDNLLTVDMKRVAENVARHPRVERAAVRRSLPGALVVTVVEYEPLVLLETEERLIALAEDGTEIPHSPEEAARLPVARVDTDDAAATVLLLAAMLPADVHARTAEIMVEAGSMTLQGRFGETVLLGDASELDRKLDIASDLIRQEKYTVIDVRFPSSPAVRTAQ